MSRRSEIVRTGLLLGALTLSGRVSLAATSPEDAARFLSQASLGADWEEIHRTAAIGPEAWLDEQFDRPIGWHQPDLDHRLLLGLPVDHEHRRWAWWQQVMAGPDPLRQRIGVALSEIFVVSDQQDTVSQQPRGLANYYDMLLANAFGNYRDILHDISLHPIMGAYLSHLRNLRSDPRVGRFPDENYAREIMQLFSIGLFRLRPDGTLLLDGMGRPIPTYDNDDITELAKVFTGLSFASPNGDFFEGVEVWTEPMRMYEPFHEPGPKNLLLGRLLPAGQTGMQDVDAAIDNLFRHPNVGPFFARKLIQRLVTSNPSPAYVERVAAAFADDGRGVRGDMKAVIRAVLLDPEARRGPVGSETGRGMLRESFLRRVHLARAFDAANQASSFPISDWGAPVNFGQRPLSSPTVFNFFLPDHQPTGEIADAGLFAPEFQIITAVTAITSANELRSQVQGVMNGDPEAALEVRLDLHDEIAIAPNARALIDRLDLLLMAGTMSAPMKELLVQILGRVPDPESRAKLAILLVSISPEYSVLK